MDCTFTWSLFCFGLVHTGTKVFRLEKNGFLVSINLFRNRIKVNGIEKTPTIDCKFKVYATGLENYRVKKGG